jgi:hypothetical protein
MHKGKRTGAAHVLRKSQKMVANERFGALAPRRIDFPTFDYQKPPRRT